MIFYIINTHSSFPFLILLSIMWYQEFDFCGSMHPIQGCPRVGFVPKSDPTRIIWVKENVARNRLEEVVGLFGSGLVGSVSSLSPRKKSSRIRRDLAEIQLNPSRSKQNLAEPGKIWPKSDLISRDLAQLSSDNGEISPDLVGKS